MVSFLFFTSTTKSLNESDWLLIVRGYHFFDGYERDSASPLVSGLECFSKKTALFEKNNGFSYTDNHLCASHLLPVKLWITSLNSVILIFCPLITSACDPTTKIAPHWTPSLGQHWSLHERAREYEYPEHLCHTSKTDYTNGNVWITSLILDLLHRKPWYSRD